MLWVYCNVKYVNVRIVNIDSRFMVDFPTGKWRITIQIQHGTFKKMVWKITLLLNIASLGYVKIRGWYLYQMVPWFAKLVYSDNDYSTYILIVWQPYTLWKLMAHIVAAIIIINYTVTSLYTCTYQYVHKYNCSCISCIYTYSYHCHSGHRHHHDAISIPMLYQ